MSPFGIEWGAFACSAFALVLVLVVRWRRVTKAGEQMASSLKGAVALSQECDGLEASLPTLRTSFLGVQELLERLKAKQPDWSGGVERDEHFEDNSRFVRFIDLQRAWEKLTGQKLRGATIVEGQTIENLTGPDWGQLRAEQAELVFAVAARRVVEYVVQASGVAGAGIDDTQVGKVLGEMANLVGLKLIDPSQGQRPDRQLHDSVGTVPVGAQQRGTIAKVEVRGLIRGNGSVMKAKVYLYD